MELSTSTLLAMLGFVFTVVGFIFYSGVRMQGALDDVAMAHTEVAASRVYTDQQIAVLSKYVELNFAGDKDTRAEVEHVRSMVEDMMSHPDPPHGH